MQMTQYQYIDVDSTIFEAEEIKNDETLCRTRARDLDSRKWLWRHDSRDLSYFV